MIVTVLQYRDRIEAGHVLGQHLVQYANRVDTLVLAMARGGVPVALQVADYLNAPMDVFVVCELVTPGRPDLALGAVATGGVRVLDEMAIQGAGVSPREVAEVSARGAAELERQQRLYRSRRAPLEVNGRIVILVDDGLPTGFAMHAAVMALHRQQPAWLIAAAPVGAPEACDDLAEEVHELVCPLRPAPFHSLEDWYRHFAPTTDAQVRECLDKAAELPRL
jgi:putative phosphoribosyl transferase